MGGTRRSEVAYDQRFSLIAKRFREDSEQVTRAPLPKRWVDLILHLDEQERKTRAGSPTSGQSLESSKLNLRSASKKRCCVS